MADLLKVGVIGVGGIARTHMPGWAASEHAEVVAGSDVDAGVLAAWGVANGIETLSTDAAELIANPDIDIIDVCTPNMYHTELTVAALDAGKHVICEKPLAPKPADIRKMIEARDRSGKLLMTAQHFRYRGTSQAMKRELETGVLGDDLPCAQLDAAAWVDPRAARLHLQEEQRRRAVHRHRRAYSGPDAVVHGQPEAGGRQRGGEEAAGQARRVRSARGAATLVPQDMDVEDFAAAFVRFENGATLVLEVSWLLHHDTPGEDMQMWLYGTEAGCHWPECKFMETNFATKQMSNRTLLLTAETMEAHALECVEFRALRGGGAAVAGAGGAVAAGDVDLGRDLSQPGGRGEVRLEG